MTLTKALTENYMPYAPVKSVLQVVRRYHERGLPEPLNADVLQQVGVSSSLYSPVFRTLLFLELVDESGMKSAKFENIRRSASNDYAATLADIVRQAYSAIFVIANPGEDELTAITDAFRKYDPANQRDRMVRLFIGLCEEAEIIQPGTHQIKTTRKPRTSSSQPRLQKVATSPATETLAPTIDETIDLDYRLVSSIVQQLPKNGHWTAEKRGKWINAMTSAIDLLIDVQDDPHYLDSLNLSDTAQLALNP